jgi:hypothetical protein
LRRLREDGEEKQDNAEPVKELTDAEVLEAAEDAKYWFQDLINIGRDMGISKMDLLENYYMDEVIILMKRQSIMNKRREEAAKKPQAEKPEVVGWDQMGI